MEDSPLAPDENLLDLSEKTEDETVVDSNTSSLDSSIGAVTKSKVKKINLKVPSKKVSALSISSLKAKKEHLLLKKEDEINQEEPPKDPFNEEEMRKHWAEYVTRIDARGQKLMASSLSSDVPKLQKENIIWIELPNDTMKKEVEREQSDLLDYLRTGLNNHTIDLKITVNEEASKKYAFTPEEKYEKLREKNPAIDLLRKEFDLDL